MRKLKQTKGITLVALILTIVILLILAVVTIRSIQGEGIIAKAIGAREKYEGAADEEQEMLDKYLKDMEGVTTGGTTTEVKIGDYVAYDEGTGYTYSSNDEYGTGVDWGDNCHMAQGTIEIEDMNWRVLGVNSDGNIELISDRPTSSELYIAREVGYMNLEKSLNDFCNTLYGNGKFALKSRSLNLDDCYKLAGGEPSDEEKRLKLDSAYGDLYQFKYSDSSDKIQLRKSEDNGETWSTWEDTSLKEFYYPGRGVVLPNIEDGDFIIEVRDNSGAPTGFLWGSGNLVARELICSNDDTWLANTWIDVQGENVIFGGANTHGGPNGLFHGSGADTYFNSAVRPVVTLDSNIKIDTSSTDGKTAETAFIIKEN